MAQQITIKGEIAKQLLEEFPNTPTLALARIAYKENPEVYKDIEDARGIIRYHRGSHGDDGRERLTDDTHVGEAGKDWRTPETFPESEAKLHEPFIVDKNLQRGLLICDLHLPYHDVKAVELALGYGEDKNVDWIIIDGDLLDFYSVSRWIRDPRKRRFSEELKMGRQVLSIIRYRFPNATIIYKMGNHEERYEKYMYTKAPELVGVEDYKIEKLLRLENFDIIPVKDKRIVKYRGLDIIHGHELYTSLWNPVNAARGLFLKGGTTSVAGHNHRTSEHVEPDLNGKFRACWSVGCLCYLKPEYSPHNKWNHGFAYIEATDDDGYTLDNIKIIDYKIV